MNKKNESMEPNHQNQLNQLRKLNKKCRMHGNKCMEINRVGGYSTRQLPWMSMTDETVHRVLSVDVDHKTVDCVDG